MTRSGRIIFKGVGDKPLLDLRAQIRREEASHDRVIGKPFSLHPAVAERMERNDG